MTPKRSAPNPSIMVNATARDVVPDKCDSIHHQNLAHRLSRNRFLHMIEAPTAYVTAHPFAQKLNNTRPNSTKNCQNRAFDDLDAEADSHLRNTLVKKLACPETGIQQRTDHPPVSIANKSNVAHGRHSAQGGRMTADQLECRSRQGPNE